MTREEAIKKLHDKTVHHGADLVNALEALGLLKFEPEAKPLIDTSLLHHCATELAIRMKVPTQSGNWVAIASIVLEAEREFNKKTT